MCTNAFVCHLNKRDHWTVFFGKADDGVVTINGDYYHCMLLKFFRWIEWT